ncbi:MAG: hypothetical protein WBA62_08300 [Xanthobacteraceae bacterium]
MSLSKPFHRNWRAMKPGSNSGYSSWAYIIDKGYAYLPAHYVRAYQMIQSDLQRLFEYVEPSPESLPTFSYRIHELLMRTCIEVEANFKAILSENLYTPPKDSGGKPQYNMRVYKKIDVTHHLSSYELQLPIWNGSEKKVFRPFEEWKTGKALSWYKAYNASKHDRHQTFKQANMKHLLDAVTGLLALLSSQFGTETFEVGDKSLSIGYGYHEMAAAIGSLFTIQFPDDWLEHEKYDFDWSILTKEAVRFSKFDYNAI